MRRCLLKCSSAIFVFLCSTYTYASSVADINHTLYVYLKNMTNHEIHFENVIANKPGNYFTVNPSSISPGETGIITAEKLINNDIDGRILFLDSNENIIMVLILDQEQIHYGQPILVQMAQSIILCSQEKHVINRLGRVI